MRTSVFALLSMAVSALAVALPVVPYTETPEHHSGFVSIVAQAHIDIGTCNNKWIEHCKNEKCGEEHIKQYQHEVAEIVALVIVNVKGSEFEHSRSEECITLFVGILLSVQATLAILIKSCATAVISATVVICAELIVQLNALIVCIGIYIPGLLVAISAKVKISILAVLGSSACDLCKGLGMGY